MGVSIGGGGDDDHDDHEHSDDDHDSAADGTDNDSERAWYTLDTGLRAAIVTRFPDWPGDGSAWSLDGAPATAPDLPAVPPVAPQVPAEQAPMLPTAPPMPAAPPPVFHGPSPQNTYLAAQQASWLAGVRSAASVPMPLRFLRRLRAEAQWWLGGGVFRE